MNKTAQTLKSRGIISLKRCRNVAAESSDCSDMESITIEAVATKEDGVAKQNSKTTSGRCQWRLTRQKKDLHYNENSSQHAGEKAKPSHGGPRGLDVLPSDKPGEASSTNQQAEATRLTRRNDDSKHNNSPSLFSWLQCPHPIFYSFESDKLEDEFQEGQIWAMYGSDNGGLPMYYVQIKKVELPKFTVHTARLEPCPSGYGILWASNELPFGCGSFKLRTGETKIFETSRRFSHQVTAVAWTGDEYSFFPWNGEVWALYKNWSAEWTLTDLKHCEYELVEVLEYDFQCAVYRVLVLEVVDGLRMIYKRAGIEVDIKRNELLRFSHCVPCFHLTEESGGNLSSYFVPDPAAMPDFIAEEKNVAEQRASEGKQEKSLQFNGIFQLPTSPSARDNCAVSLSGCFTKSTTLLMALSSEEAKDSQTFGEWAHHGFLEVGSHVDPAKFKGIGDEYGKGWVQRCPKLFALFNPKPHYGTIIGVSESYLGLIRSSLWGTFANLVKEVAHLDCMISNSQFASLTNKLKGLKEAGFPIRILKNRLKALAFQAQQMASATLEALEVAKAAAPSMECLEAAVAAEGAAEIEIREIEEVLAEARRKLKAAKVQYEALRERKIAMDAKEMDIEVARQELEVAEAHLSQVSQL